MLNLSYNILVLVIRAKAIFILYPIAFCAKLSGIAWRNSNDMQNWNKVVHRPIVVAERLAETEGLVN